MSDQENELRNLIETANQGLSESRKVISELKTKLRNEETIAIGFKIHLEKLQTRLKRLLSSMPNDTEYNQKNSDIDSEFRSKLDSLLKEIK